MAAPYFPMGMTPIVEYFTGQKAISSWGPTGWEVTLKRDDTFSVIWQLALSLMDVFARGVLMTL